jgi:molybdopterin/thiamine biosynthesis adenylyltransferase
MTTTLFRPTRLILLAMAALIVYAAVIAMAPVIDDLQAIPMTQHALQQHQGQLYDAAAITARMNAHTCSPIESYTCKDTVVMMCPVGPNPNGLWIGLVIGTANPAGPQIVTGYAAPASYWHGRVASCKPMALVP